MNSTQTTNFRKFQRAFAENNLIIKIQNCEKIEITSDLLIKFTKNPDLMNLYQIEFKNNSKVEHKDNNSPYFLNMDSYSVKGLSEIFTFDKIKSYL